MVAVGAPSSLAVETALRFGMTLVALVTVSAVAGSAALAAAKQKPCADLVIADWYDHGRVAKIYPLECYRQAIAKLPTDVLDYSNAKEEITRALAFAKVGKQDPGGTGSSRTPSIGTAATGTGAGGTKTKGHKHKPTGATDTTTTGTGTFTGTTDTSGPSSVPVPLLVLGGLALLLLAAGSAGYLRRRLNGGDAGGDGPPPAP